ncbi:hypothetical protein F0Z19_0187 [Vibrio cyclitrophicus]|nr:hypothetical protein M565_ctg5P1210 [Vibrio cyclitrophicus FF75]KAA8602654.1 hypothetical protein F0Z19_0187 [Vibrio cyclitrophicus]
MLSAIWQWVTMAVLATLSSLVISVTSLTKFIFHSNYIYLKQ